MLNNIKKKCKLNNFEVGKIFSHCLNDQMKVASSETFLVGMCATFDRIETMIQLGEKIPSLVHINSRSMLAGTSE